MPQEPHQGWSFRSEVGLVVLAIIIATVGYGGLQHAKVKLSDSQAYDGPSYFFTNNRAFQILRTPTPIATPSPCMLDIPGGDGTYPLCSGKPIRASNGVAFTYNGLGVVDANGQSLSFVAYQHPLCDTAQCSPGQTSTILLKPGESATFGGATITLTWDSTMAARGSVTGASIRLASTVSSSVSLCNSYTINGEYALCMWEGTSFAPQYAVYLPDGVKIRVTQITNTGVQFEGSSTMFQPPLSFAVSQGSTFKFAPANAPYEVLVKPRLIYGNYAIVSVIYQTKGMMAEVDTCKFYGSTTLQQCTNNVGTNCTGITSCNVPVSGEPNRAIDWRSSCPNSGNLYGTTYSWLTGVNKDVPFSCGAPIPTIKPGSRN